MYWASVFTCFYLFPTPRGYITLDYLTGNTGGSVSFYWQLITESAVIII